MTKKDIDNIISIICPNDEDFEKPCISPAYLKKELEALALEQEPCEDAISRQAVLDYIHRIFNQGTGKKKSFEFIQKYVEKLPPVTPSRHVDCEGAEHDGNQKVRNKYVRYRISYQNTRRNA